MIAIKSMEMPKNLQECKFKYVSHKSICCLIDGRVRELDGKTQMKFLQICLNCPLVELGSEDMSWEELVNKCKSEFSQKNFQYEENQFGYSKKHMTKINFLIEDENYPDEVGCITFREEGIVECGAYAPSEGFFKSNIKPFQMWQIIQALVGER